VTFVASPDEERHRHRHDGAVLGGIKGSLAALGGSAALDTASAPPQFAFVDGTPDFWMRLSAPKTSDTDLLIVVSHMLSKGSIAESSGIVRLQMVSDRDTWVHPRRILEIRQGQGLPPRRIGRCARAARIRARGSEGGLRHMSLRSQQQPSDSPSGRVAWKR
jgi:hypothetical protein